MEAHDVERFEVRRALDLQVAVLRLQRSKLLRGASDRERSVIATIVSELGTNVLKYASRGSLEMRRLRDGPAAEIEIVVRDDGPGIPDVELALTDRYSSGRTLGLGLPGVRRMADELSIEANAGGGTVVRARKRLKGPPSGTKRATPTPSTGVPDVGRGPWRAGAALRPRAGQSTCGDAVAVVERGELVLLAVIDATGHGERAHAVARDLVVLTRERFTTAGDPHDLPGLLHALHQASIGTAGAAAGLALIDGAHDRLRYLAIGNVRAALLGRGRFSGVARDGMLGRRWPTPFVQSTQVQSGDLVLLWTDGLPEGLARALTSESSADFASRPRERPGPGDAADPGAIAEHAADTFAKPHDDAALLVLAWRSDRARP